MAGASRLRTDDWGDSWGRSVQPYYFAAVTDFIVFCSIMHSGVQKDCTDKKIQMYLEIQLWWYLSLLHTVLMTAHKTTVA